ncbi:type II toxin-antitoxin system RelE/ParE family toxin [Methylomagnum sp.]
MPSSKNALSDTLACMKRVFKTRYFQRWMRKTELTDAMLCNAVFEMERGLIGAELVGAWSRSVSPCLEREKAEAAHSGGDESGRPLVLRVWFRKEPASQYRRQ